jgi:hypothetical protein
MSTDHLFQIGIIAANVISGLAWFAIRREIAHLREVFEIKIGEVERRLDKLEAEG